MKKNETFTSKILKKVVEKTLITDANRTSCAVVFQPKVPAMLENFKKDKK